MELAFELEYFGHDVNISFLDVLFVSVQPLVTILSWKPTHASLWAWVCAR